MKLYFLFLFGFLNLTCTISQSSKIDKKVQPISEDEYNNKTKHLPFFDDYISPYEALVIRGDDNKYYINHKGVCFVVDNLSTADSLLKKRNEIKPSPEMIKYLDDLSTIQIDSISAIVNQSLQKLNVEIQVFDDDGIHKIDEQIAILKNREALLPAFYLIVGEYFRYVINNEYRWDKLTDSTYNKSIPTLVNIKTGQPVQFSLEVFQPCSNLSVSTPLYNACQIIFWKL